MQQHDGVDFVRPDDERRDNTEPRGDNNNKSDTCPYVQQRMSHKLRRDRRLPGPTCPSCVLLVAPAGRSTHTVRFVHGRRAMQRTGGLFSSSYNADIIDATTDHGSRYTNDLGIHGIANGHTTCVDERVCLLYIDKLPKDRGQNCLHVQQRVSHNQHRDRRLPQQPYPSCVLLLAAGRSHTVHFVHVRRAMQRTRWLFSSGDDMGVDVTANHDSRCCNNVGVNRVANGRTTCIDEGVCLLHIHKLHEDHNDDGGDHDVIVPNNNVNNDGDDHSFTDHKVNNYGGDQFDTDKRNHCAVYSCVNRRPDEFEPAHFAPPVNTQRQRRADADDVQHHGCFSSDHIIFGSGGSSGL